MSVKMKETIDVFVTCGQMRVLLAAGFGVCSALGATEEHKSLWDLFWAATVLAPCLGAPSQRHSSLTARQSIATALARLHHCPEACSRGAVTLHLQLLGGGCA
jgi:hypothetical protein